MSEVAVNKRTRIQNILLLLIEFGAVYCFIQLLYAIFTLLDTSATVHGLLRSSELTCVVEAVATGSAVSAVFSFISTTIAELSTWIAGMVSSCSNHFNRGA